MKQESKVKFDAIKAIIEKWDASSDPSENKKIDSLLAMANKWATSGTGKANEWKRLTKALEGFRASLKTAMDNDNTELGALLEKTILEYSEKRDALGYEKKERQKKVK